MGTEFQSRSHVGKSREWMNGLMTPQMQAANGWNVRQRTGQAAHQTRSSKVTMNISTLTPQRKCSSSGLERMLALSFAKYILRTVSEKVRLFRMILRQD